ncbi:MAG: TonB-dependent receptor [Candidatus Edwardsbacteria bacterium]|nr:TonB-dependent receptor [Candidatus Edwardsbacteria bacterium]
MKLKTIFMAAALVLWAAGLLKAGDTGKIAGRVMDAGNGDPLMGASVQLLGTNKGALTDSQGYYYIINIPSGKYSLKAYTTGYASMTVTDVKCNQDLTTKVDFRIKPSPIKTEGIVVVAERPVVDKDLTATRRAIRLDDFPSMPWDTPEKALASQAGVVMKGESFHVRGGRSDEVNYLIDGISVRDATDGTTGLLLNSNALSDLTLLTGIFDAEYGEVMSGVINATVKDGGNRQLNFYHNNGSVFGDLSGRGYRNYQFDAGRSFRGDKVKLFTAGDLTLTDDWDPHRTKVPHQDREDYSLVGKATFNLPYNIRASLLGVQSRSQYGRYSHDWYYMPANYRSDLKKGRLGVFSLNQTISNATFYKISLGWFWNKNQFGVRDTFWDIGRYWWEDIRFLDFWDNQVYYNEYDKLVFTTDYNRYGYDCMLFYRFGNYWKYRERITDERFVKFDLTSQASKYHQLKYGAELKRYIVDNLYLYPTAIGNPIFDVYCRKPSNIGAYFQDKVEYDGLVLNLGVRYERLDLDIKDADTNALWARALEGGQIEARQFVSPRLGLSYVISPNTTFHLGYGRYFQQPQLQYYYQYLKAYDPSEIEGNILGNPALKPSRSTSLEFGTVTELNRDLSADITIYYRDIKDLVSVNLVPALPVPYYQYENVDYASSKGVEVCLKKHYGRHVTGSIRYAFSSSEGTGADANDVMENYLSTVSGESLGTLPRDIRPLDFDQRNKLVVEASLFNKDPVAGRWGWFIRDANLTGIFQFGSGLPYTPLVFNTDKQATPDPSLQRTPSNSQIDIKFTKSFKYYLLNATLSFEILNLFNWDNYNYSYEREISPYEIYTRDWQPEDPQSDYFNTSPYYEAEGDTDGNGVFTVEEQWNRILYYQQLYSANPALSGMPRLYRAGLTIKF